VDINKQINISLLNNKLHNHPSLGRNRKTSNIG